MTARCTVCEVELPADTSEPMCAECTRSSGASAPSHATPSRDDLTVSLGGGAAVKPRTSISELSRIGDYRLDEEIARGGMGVVFRARQVSLGRDVALKMILPEALKTGAEIVRFRTEAQAAARLDHPNIVPIYEVGHDEGRHYYSMRLIQGKNLARRLKEYAGKHRDIAYLMMTLARAVHYSHCKGILHRDIKPGNIIIGEWGEPYLGDFGLAKRVKSRSELTEPGALIGTPAYMAPEQARGDHEAVGAATDVYSLGAVLYELLTGKPPFHGKTRMETVAQVIEKPSTAPRSIDPKIPKDLEAICLRCLEKDAVRRYGSAQELADDLERFLGHLPVLARKTAGWERLVKWTQRRPALAALVGFAILVAIGGFFVGLWGWQQAEKARGLEAEREIYPDEVRRNRIESRETD